MQSYNNEKDMFACTTTGGTPLFAEKALRSLAFSQRDIEELQKLNRSTRWPITNRKKTIRALKAAINHLEAILNANLENPIGFGAR